MAIEFGLVFWCLPGCLQWVPQDTMRVDYLGSPIVLVNPSCRIFLNPDEDPQDGRHQCEAARHGPGHRPAVLVLDQGSQNG